MSYHGREQSYRDPVHDFITLRHPIFLDWSIRRKFRGCGASASWARRTAPTTGRSTPASAIPRRLVGDDQDPGAVSKHRRGMDEVVTVARAAALLHDIGHGPFSHALEGRLTPGARPRGVDDPASYLSRGGSQIALAKEHPQLPEMVAPSSRASLPALRSSAISFRARWTSTGWIT